MGFGFHAQAALPRRGWRRQRVTPAEFLEDLEHAVLQGLPDPLLQQALRVARDPELVRFKLHPAAECLEFSLAEAGSVTCTARTSSAGPGYHAFAWDWVARAGRTLKLDWQWSGDATGYGEHRDLARVQAHAAAWMQDVAQQVLDAPGHRPVAVNLPVGTVVEEPAFAAAPTGFWPEAFFRELVTAPAARAAALSSQILSWWDGGLTARTWWNWGAALAWVELPWHQARNRDEEEAYALTAACFARALALDPALPLPRAELEEVERFRRPTAGGAPAPHAALMGFRRRPMRQALPGGWSVVLPGCFHRAQDEDGATVSWLGGRHVRARSYGVNHVLSAARMQKVVRERQARRGGTVLEREEPDGVAAVALVRPADPGEEAVRVLESWTIRGSELCELTVSVDDPADGPWMEQTWRSVQHLG